MIARCKCGRKGTTVVIENNTVRRVCDLCSFFRFGMTKKELTAYAQDPLNE